jgi:hypothetical protein
MPVLPISAGSNCDDTPYSCLILIVFLQFGDRKSESSQSSKPCSDGTFGLGSESERVPVGDVGAA